MVFWSDWNFVTWKLRTIDKLYNITFVYTHSECIRFKMNWNVRFDEFSWNFINCCRCCCCCCITVHRWSAGDTTKNGRMSYPFRWINCNWKIWNLLMDGMASVRIRHIGSGNIVVISIKIPGIIKNCHFRGSVSNIGK